MKQYLKFLNAVSNLALPFDYTGQQLLEEIAMFSDDGESITVGEAMTMVHIASPATIHRKLSDLLAFGYVNFAQRGTDRRTKYLELTPKAVAYFEKLETLMLKAAK